MLTQGSMVLIREDGTRKPVEQLQISDLVFDPWADEYVEIVDILSRKVEFDGEMQPWSNPLYPVTLKSGCIAKSRPTTDLLVSPSQPVRHVEKLAQPGSLPILKKSRAQVLACDPQRQANPRIVQDVTYYAVFTQQQRTLDVSGVLLSTFSADVYGEDTARGFAQKSHEETHRRQQENSAAETSGKAMQPSRII